ncbi:MAG TPA: hypothetical protein VIM58_12640 [Candidatus Methylacidiphilales bacterium]
MPIPPSLRRRGPRAAFSLIEVSLAVGIVGFAFVTLVGLVVPGLKNVRVSSDEIDAVSLAQGVFADLRYSSSMGSDGKPAPASGRYALPLPLSVKAPTSVTLRLLGDGTTAPDAASEMVYGAVLDYVPSGAAQQGTSGRPAWVRVTIRWPAGAPEGRAQGSWQGLAAFPQPRAQWR